MVNLRISLSKKEMGVVFGAITALAFIVVLIPNGQADDKVIVGFYGESLCPDCIAFCTGPLHKAFQEASHLMHALSLMCNLHPKATCNMFTV